MDIFQLNLYFFCKNGAFCQSLSKHAGISGIDCTFIEADSDTKATDSWNTVVLSDNIETISSYITGGYQNIWIVYLGEFTDLKNLGTEKIRPRLDVWKTDGCEEFLEFRFHGFLHKVKEWHDARWYKKILTDSINSIPDLVWYKNAEGAHMLVNDAFCQTVNKTREDITGRGHYYIWDITPEEYSSGEFVCMESESTVMEAGRTIMFEEPVKTREGMKYFNTYKTPIYDLSGKIWGTVGVAHDTTDLSNMGIELSVLVENIPFPMVVCSKDWKVVKMNSYFRRLFDIEENSSIDYRLFKEKMLVPCSNKEMNNYNHSITQEHYLVRDGIQYTFSIAEQDILDYFGAVRGHFCLLRDITTLKRYQQELYELAHTDSLTGLHNRRSFYDYVKNHACENMHLLYMDLDNFKQVNDQYGHDRGDDVLRKLSASILTLFPDGVAARLGGDEFALVLFGNVDEVELKEKILQLEDSVKAMFREGDFHISISVGFVKCNNETDLDVLLAKADAKMYSIKQEHHKELKKTGI